MYGFLYIVHKPVACIFRAPGLNEGRRKESNPEELTIGSSSPSHPMASFGSTPGSAMPLAHPLADSKFRSALEAWLEPTGALRKSPN